MDYVLNIDVHRANMKRVGDMSDWKVQIIVDSRGYLLHGMIFRYDLNFSRTAR